MHIALFPTKVTNYVSYFLWKVMRYVTFEMFVFNIKKLLFYKCKKVKYICLRLKEKWIHVWTVVGTAQTNCMKNMMQEKKFNTIQQ